MEYLNISYNIHLVNWLEHLNDAVDTYKFLGIVITAPMSVANDSASPYHSLHIKILSHVRYFFNSKVNMPVSSYNVSIMLLKFDAYSFERVKAMK